MIYIFMAIMNLKKGNAIIKHNDDHRILMSFFIANMICKKK